MRQPGPSTRRELDNVGNDWYLSIEVHFHVISCRRAPPASSGSIYILGHCCDTITGPSQLCGARPLPAPAPTEDIPSMGTTAPCHVGLKSTTKAAIHSLALLSIFATVYLVQCKMYCEIECEWGHTLVTWHWTSLPHVPWLSHSCKHSQHSCHIYISANRS